MFSRQNRPLLDRVGTKSDQPLGENSKPQNASVTEMVAWPILQDIASNAELSEIDGADRLQKALSDLVRPQLVQRGFLKPR